MYADIPTYHERVAHLIEQLRDQGHLGLILIDASELAQVEHDYGSKVFHQVLSICPSDGPSQLFLARIQQLRQAPPQESWDGVFTILTK